MFAAEFGIMVLHSNDIVEWDFKNGPADCRVSPFFEGRDLAMKSQPLSPVMAPWGPRLSLVAPP